MRAALAGRAEISAVAFVGWRAFYQGAYASALGNEFRIV